MIDIKGLLLVISGPSGAGKGTICKDLVKKNSSINLSVSATTRSPREGEVEGVNYFFKTKDEFLKMVDEGGFLEYASIYDNYYGTPKEAILSKINAGEDVILEIEMQGAMQVKKAFPEAVLVFIVPPSLKELKARIVGRGTETKEQIDKRMSSSLDEIRLLENYSYFVVNNTVEDSVEKVESIIEAEKSRVSRYKDLIISEFEKEVSKC